MPPKEKPPEHLNASAKAIWIETLDKLSRLTELQLEALTAYASEKARYLEATKWLDENGLTVIMRTDKGDPKLVIEAPQVKIAERALASYLKIGAVLGLDKKKAGPKL
jgi:P27 family predicted phage terminase small subunit